MILGFPACYFFAKEQAVVKTVKTKINKLVLIIFNFKDISK